MVQWTLTMILKPYLDGGRIISSLRKPTRSYGGRLARLPVLTSVEHWSWFLQPLVYGPQLRLSASSGCRKDTCRWVWIKKTLLLGNPSIPKGKIREIDWVCLGIYQRGEVWHGRERELREIDFNSNRSPLRFGKSRSLDHFNDGSFYLHG